MEDLVADFKKKYPGIQISDESYDDVVEIDDDHEEEIHVERYQLTSVPNLEGLSLIIDAEADLKRLDKIVSSKPKLLKDILGMKVGDDVQLVLSKVVGSPRFFGLRLKPVNISMGYKSKSLEIEIHFGQIQKTEIGFLAEKMVGIRSPRNCAIAKISGLDSDNLADIETDAKSVLKSVLFDLECTYGEVYETANLESLKPNPVHKIRPKPKLPGEPIILLYKPYIHELVEYFHTGERVDHLPFKFICYFHIIEYFMDKSAHSVVSKKIRQIISSPDFHQKSSEYINDAIKVFKVETEKFMSDKAKINRVLGEYIDREAMSKFLADNGLKDYFGQEHTFKFAKDLKIPAMKFDSDSTFIESLNRRIYSIRCSIVHSNPDFDESKAVPFTPTTHNMNMLRREIELIKEVSRTIIVNSVA